MLKNSFLFLPGIGCGLEQKIWNQGITDWRQFLDAKKISGISKKRKLFYDRQLRIAFQNLDNPYFFRFPGSESWRLFDICRHDCVYLDIEAVGFDVVLVGVSDGDSYAPLVKGHNLTKHDLFRALKNSKMVVTFNGMSFDVPFLKKFFGSFPAIPCFDLRFCLQRLGFTGGLKKIEKDFSLSRSFECVDIFSLWQNYSLGCRKSFDELISYNHDDVMNLIPLADKTYSLMKETFFSSVKNVF